jgi:hypothetical protein
MADLACPECSSPLSKEEIKTKCESSVHLFKVAARNVEAKPTTVVIQCPKGHLVEVQCSEAS